MKLPVPFQPCLGILVKLVSLVPWHRNQQLFQAGISQPYHSLLQSTLILLETMELSQNLLTGSIPLALTQLTQLSEYLFFTSHREVAFAWYLLS